jgi:hypothetical protein
VLLQEAEADELSQLHGLVETLVRESSDRKTASHYPPAKEQGVSPKCFLPIKECYLRRFPLLLVLSCSNVR